MIRWLATNIRTFLWALAMALAVWVAAVAVADPDEVRQYPDPIPIEIVGQDPGLVITGDVPEEIELTLRAPSSVWQQMLAHTRYSGSNIHAPGAHHFQDASNCYH